MTTSSRHTRITGTQAATAGLFVAWLVHDVEELLTLRQTSSEVFSRLPARVGLPAGWREEGMPQRQIVVGIGLMGVVIAAASERGRRTGGRSGLFQTVLLGFGLHGIGHVAGAAALRGYASGVATSPTLVIPFWLWATRRLAAGGVPVDRSWRGAALGVPLTWALLGLAHVFTRRRGALP